MRPIYYLGVFIPVAIGLELAHAGPGRGLLRRGAGA